MQNLRLLDCWLTQALHRGLEWERIGNSAYGQWHAMQDRAKLMLMTWLCLSLQVLQETLVVLQEAW